MITETEKLITFAPKPVDLKAVRTYCGPTVLRLLTGKGKEEIFRDVNRLRRKNGKKLVVMRKRGHGGDYRKPWPLTKPVKGMMPLYMDQILTKYGFRPKRVKCAAGPKQSLATFADDVAPVKKPIVVVSGNHFLLLVRGIVFDTFKPDGEPFATHPFAKTRVTEYWILNAAPDFAPAEAAGTPQDTPAPVDVPSAPEPVAALPAPAPSPKPGLRARRHAKAKANADKWAAKARRAEKMAKKWAAKVRYYERTMF